jgi:hypothetical protein
MVPCQKGAILNHGDLKVSAAAAELAAEYCESILRAETPLGRRANPEERELLIALGLSARAYRRHLRSIERVRKAKRRG